MRILGPKLAENTSINILDLSHNFLGGKKPIDNESSKKKRRRLEREKSNSQLSGQLIGKIISRHNEKRNETVWLYSIRNDSPPDSPLSNGLIEINLENNSLGDEFIKEMMKFRVRYDTWLRSINLRQNNISTAGVKELLSILHSNQNIFTLDLRGNPGFTPQYSKIFVRKLCQNLNSYRQLQEKQKEVL